MKPALQFDLPGTARKCRCGGQLILSGGFYVCHECRRLYCPSCFGMVIPSGGCFHCMNCGWSACA